jgi:cytochrome b6-f complex iron-sulfur subunit
MSESIDRMEGGARGEPVSRRGFLKYVLVALSAVATAGGLLAPIIAYLWPPKQGGAATQARVAVASTADLPLGKGAVYSVNNRPVIVIHTQDGFHALSATCTHLGCIVFWNEQRSVIACPCHEGFYNINGAVISGPPPAPLTVFQVQVEADQIYVQGGQS